MEPSQYFPEQYEIDRTQFVDGAMCMMTMSSLWEDLAKWPYIEHFLICQYDLNLLSQVVYAHFREDYPTWSAATISHIPCGQCHGVYHPIDILRVADKALLSKGIESPITNELILAYDTMFMNYLKKICSEHVFTKLTPEAIIEAIKNDPDCSNQRAKDYFASK